MGSADREQGVSTFKSKGGWQRVVKACTYSCAGLWQAWSTEPAFRQELFVVLPASVLAVLLPLTPVEKLGLIAVLVLLLIVELLNSAIEAAIDRISLDAHPLARNAKDFGSAAVMLAIMLAVATWSVVLWPLLFT
jgi:diacylglycerol kinase (ATP)